MKLLIIGSRKITDFDLSKYVSEDVDLIISGGAKGIDSLAEIYADEHGIKKLIIHPQYNLYGRAAPIRRNEQMVDVADSVLAIWDGCSKGTKYTVDYAEKKNKATVVVLPNEQ
jgi:hypothetical protein